MNATRIQNESDPFWITRNPVGVLRRKVRGTSDRRPPGPKGRPFIGVLPEFKTDPFNYLKGLNDTYGDIYRVPLPGYDVVVMNHPDHVARIMNCRNGEYSMLGPGMWISKILGASIPMMEGELFKQRRKMLTPMFGRKHLTEVAEIVSAEFESRLEGWNQYAESGEIIDLQHEISRLTMPAFMKAMFSVELTGEEITRFDTDLRTLMKAVASTMFLSPLPRVLPGDDNFVQTVRRMQKWVGTVIDARQQSGAASRTDLLQVMLDARYEDGAPITRKDLVMEMIILMAGGYETVVASLSWTLGLLPTNPAAQEKLFEEIEVLEGNRPNFDDLERLPWARQCFDEAQRLQGHPFHPRFAMIDDEVDGYRIPKGTLVGVSMYALHRDERWWGPNANSYDPNRFDKSVSKDRPTLAFIPFGAGPHRCLGSAMAYMNAQFLLALIHQRFRVHTRPGWTPKHASTFSCTVEGGVPVTLTRVQPQVTTPEESAHAGDTPTSGQCPYTAK